MQGSGKEDHGVDGERTGRDGGGEWTRPKLARDWPSDVDERAQAVRWGVDVILTDVTKTWLDLRNALHGQPARACSLALLCS